jgi:hypothetical protein
VNSHQLSVARRVAVVLLLLLPAAVVAIVVLLQSGTLPKYAVPRVHAGTPPLLTLEQAEQHVATANAKRSDALAYGWAGAGLLLALGVASAGVLARRSRRAGGPVHDDRAATRDRRVLIEACTRLYDSLESLALREQLADSLSQAGVSLVEVDPDTPFDPRQHRAVETERTTNAALHDRVSRTERPGILDRGERLRWPEVVVFDARGAHADTP